MLRDSFNDSKYIPFIVEKDGIIQDVSDMFINFTGFEKDELNNKPISTVWKSLFRIDTDLNFINIGLEIILFTKSLEVRFVTVSKTEDIKKCEIMYKFIEKANSRIENKMLFIERLIHDGKFGIAIYTAQDFTMLKANQMYLDYLPKLFNTKELAYGKRLTEILPGFKNGHGERELRRIVESNETLYITELKGLWCGSDDRYWDNTITPIVEDGEVKYIVSMLQDVTERVLSREREIIKNEQLDTILNSVSDIICILDKHGNYVSGNQFSRKYFDLYKENVNSTKKCFKILDCNEKELDSNELDFRKVLNGKEIEKVRVNIELNGEVICFKLSGKLIYDKNYEVAYAVFVMQDITTEIERMKIIEQQNRELLQSYKQIEAQKKELDTIFQNMSDGLFVVNKHGRIIKRNKAFEEVSRKLFNDKNVVNHVNKPKIYGWKHCDEDGRELLTEESPITKLLKGKFVKQQRIMSVKGTRKTYVDFSCTPIFDESGNFRYGIALGHDITEKIEKENKIKEQQELLYKSERSQREILEKALIMKDEFISLISHEFKTPLNVIYSAIQLIEYMYSNELPERVKELIRSIKQNTFRQLRLVNNLLDITRLKSGRLKLHMRNIDIILLTKMIVESVRLYVEQKNIKLSVKTNVDSKIIAVDDEKYERILLNLLSNAIKFTSDGGDITVNIKEDKILNTVDISVIDTGIGIPKEKQKLIFERFGQVESSLSRQAEGTGIGLSLVKLLVDVLEGRINVKSKLGIGSIFEVILPVKECVENEQNGSCLDADTRLINAINVEFSDIYF